MRAGWQEITTAELISSGALEIGDGYRAKNSEMSHEGLPFIRAGDVNGRVNIIGADLLSHESVQKAGSKVSRVGDVVITTKGTVGRLAIVRPDDPIFVYSPQLCFWRSRNSQRIHPNWLYYALQSNDFIHQMQWSAAQTDMAPYISLTDQRTFFKLKLPPLSEQRDIATTLGALDDKIELNRKMNATLEAIALALFRDWFVDFGPTRAKMEGRAPYLAPDIWSLFPDRLDEEGKPEGWEAGLVSDLVSFNPRESLTKGTEAPYLEMSALPTQGPNHAEPVIRPFVSGSKFRDGDTLMARITPCLENGKTCLVDGLGQGVVAWGSTEFIVMRPKPPLPPAFGYLLARDNDFRAAAIRSMTGTSGRQRATVDTLEGRPSFVPSDEVMSAFSYCVDPLFGHISANERENRTLGQTRDLLLPRLMAGELRVQFHNVTEAL